MLRQAYSEYRNYFLHIKRLSMLCLTEAAGIL
jgi:hypothetical protein